MYRRTFLFSAVVVLLSVTLASAKPFVNPPETDPLVPPGGWATTFPYPRNVMIDFATDPDTWPADPNGPPGSKDLVPDLNCHLEGQNDDWLFGSDWVSWEGDYVWINTDDRFPTRQGLVGLDALGSASVTAVFHLDNEPIIRPVKHVWVELEYYFGGTGSATWDAETIPAPGSTETDFKQHDEYLGGGTFPEGWYRTNFWVEVEPNPPWEEFQMEVSTVGATTVLFDYAHIATECVPEPGTCTLLAVGSLGLIVWFWRRKSAK